MLMILPLISGVSAYGSEFILPGNPTPASACRQAAVVSTDQFTTTGIPQVRTVQPNEQVVAGAWVLADSRFPETSVTAARNCPFTSVGKYFDNYPTNVIGLRINTSIGNAKEMDLQELDYYWDVNLNGHLDPGIDLLMQVHRESDLTERLNNPSQGIVWYNGPESPLFVLGDIQGLIGIPGLLKNVNAPKRCDITAVEAVQRAHSIANHPNIIQTPSESESPCAVGILAVVKVGPNPKTGADFALQLQAKAADVPGAFRNSATGGVGGPSLASNISSAFAPSDNPQASNILLLATGGHASSTETPVSNISNGSGSVETDITTLHFSNLKTRFRADPITPGARDAIDIAVAICDGSAEANNQVTFLPPIAGAPPTIAGGLAALPCIKSAGSDGLDTGVNGAVLIFSGPGAKYIRQVRMWADLRGGVNYGAIGGGDGILFQANEQIQQVTARYNPATGEAIAVLGHTQEQIFTSTTGMPIVAVDPLCAAGNAIGLTVNGARRCAAPGIAAVNPNPSILVFTSDIGQDAIGAKVDVRLGLQVGDDTSQTFNGICARAVGFGVASGPVNCGSNLLTIGPETSSFEIVGPTAPPVTPKPPVVTPTTKTIEQVIDANGNGIIEDSEIIAAVGYWTNGTTVPGTNGKTITDTEILKLAALWTTGNPITTATAAGVSESQSSSLWEQIVSFFAPKPAALSATQATTASQVAPGASFEVTVNLKARQANGGLILSEQLPTGWTATPVASGSAYAKVNQAKWLWLGVQGQTSVTYRVDVPAEAQAGTYQIGGTLSSAGTEQASVNPLTINVAGSVQVLAVKSVKAQSLGNGTTQFVVSGSSVAGLSVQVYDLSGAAVFTKTTSGQTLTFRGLGTDGQLLANGVYLYVVTVKGINGQSATTQVKKLVVLR
mgnify:CR=1 FL=1